MLSPASGVAGMDIDAFDLLEDLIGSDSDAPWDSCDGEADRLLNFVASGLGTAEDKQQQGQGQFRKAPESADDNTFGLDELSDVDWSAICDGSNLTSPPQHSSHGPSQRMHSNSPLGSASELPWQPATSAAQRQPPPSLPIAPIPASTSTPAVVPKAAANHDRMASATNSSPAVPVGASLSTTSQPLSLLQPAAAVGSAASTITPEASGPVAAPAPAAHLAPRGHVTLTAPAALSLGSSNPAARPPSACPDPLPPPPPPPPQQQQSLPQAAALPQPSQLPPRQLTRAAAAVAAAAWLRLPPPDLVAMGLLPPDHPYRPSTRPRSSRLLQPPPPPPPQQLPVPVVPASAPGPTGRMQEATGGGPGVPPVTQPMLSLPMAPLLPPSPCQEEQQQQLHDRKQQQSGESSASMQTEEAGEFPDADAVTADDTLMDELLSMSSAELRLVLEPPGGAGDD
ncbi:hypothetical protein Agub_g6752, partial [Astrephomene gubernaculifera]